jgi:hypothetical protein
VSYWRHMRTTQERRQWFADVLDVLLRRGRSPHLLPNAWDDVRPTRERNWKSQRKTQWRGA